MVSDRSEFVIGMEPGMQFETDVRQTAGRCDQGQIEIAFAACLWDALRPLPLGEGWGKGFRLHHKNREDSLRPLPWERVGVRGLGCTVKIEKILYALSHWERVGVRGLG
jgi:hypothetical protein